MASEVTQRQRARCDRQTTPAGQRCEWKYDDIDDFYETQCGEGYCCNDGTINEHKIKFCPFCGGKIEQALDRLATEGVRG